MRYLKWIKRLPDVTKGLGLQILEDHSEAVVAITASGRQASVSINKTVRLGTAESLEGYSKGRLDRGLLW